MLHLFFPQTFLQTNKSQDHLSFCPIPLTALIEPFASCQPLFCTLSHAVYSSPAVLLNLQNIKLISFLINDQFYKLGYAACTYLSINSSTCLMYCTYQDGVSKHESHIFTCPVHNQNIHFQGQIIFKYAKQLLMNELCFFHKLSYNKKLMVSNHINFKLSREDTQDIF